METKVEKMGKSKVKVVVTVSPEEMVKYFKHAYDELAPGVKLPGFRPGKAPRKMVEDSLGISRLLSHALDEAMQENYSLALAKEKLMPVSQPNISINKYPNYGLDAEEIKNPFEFEAEIEVLPEFELGDYSKLSVEKGKAEEVKDADIEKIFDHFRKQKATFLDVDRPAKMGDFTEISYEGSIKHVKIEQMTSKNHPVVLGEGNLIPGFEDQIIGMKKGEGKTFKITFPKDYHAKEFAGKEAEFKINLNELKEVQLPELNDEFAKGFGRKDVKELREAVAESLKKELDEKYRNELEMRVVEKVLPLMKVDLPESLISQEVDRMMHEYEHQFKDRGMSMETFLKSTKKTVEDLRKDMRPQAEKNVKVGLLLGRIIEEQKIDHHDPEAGKKALDFLVNSLTKKQ